MLYISDSCTDPQQNLAAEEYLLKNFKEPIFRLWRNAPSIIVGRYQNTLAEIDYNYVKENNITVVRRLTGGGAVFHDLGNLNYTFIENKENGEKREETNAMFRRFTKPIIEALRAINVNASLEGRNDLLIEGRKFSGNAICIHKNRILQHGTLMFDVSTNNLSAALRSRPEKFQDKAVKSNRSRVTNIKEHLTLAGIRKSLLAYNLLKERALELQRLDSRPTLKDADVIWFMNYLGAYITARQSQNASQPQEARQTAKAGPTKETIIPYSYTPQQRKEIDALTLKRYSTDKWNYGHSPKYTFGTIKKLKGGIMEFYVTVDKGIITKLDIRGDYFFTNPTEEFIKQIVGTPHTKEEIAKKIGALNLNAYFADTQPEDIVNLFF